MNSGNGYFVVSLDFELLYGMNDASKIERWKKNVIGARTAIPKILKLFEAYHVKATWAIVGMLFAKDKEELANFVPKRQPHYEEDRFSNYAVMAEIGANEQKDPFHYAWSLVEQIAAGKGQEVATHTFSHYYCMEKGQTAEDFAEDIAAAAAIAEKKGIRIKSLVFPKNQYRDAYLDKLGEKGITAVRGNESGWVYKPSSSGESLLKRAVRLLDSYINLSGYHCYDVRKLERKGQITNIPASRFLRPYSSLLKYFEVLKISRIKGQMRHAAKKGYLFHLWWHPHNFGSNQQENLKNLQIIMNYYTVLSEKYNFMSVTMTEAAAQKRESTK